MDFESAFGSRDERARLLAGALGWLTANLAHFDPPQEDELFDAPESVLPGPRRKAFGELGLALLLVGRVPALRAHAEVRLLTRTWLEMAGARNIFFDARRRVHLVPLMAVALAVMREIGAAPEWAVRALQAVLDRRFLDRTERSAWSQADIVYYLDALGLRHALPDAATLYRRSSLRALPAIVHACRLDLYAVTHLVFHLSDFGARPLPGASQRELADLRDYLALALAASVAEKDWDLVAELVITRLCLGDGRDALSHFATAALLEVQQPAGFVPDGRAAAGAVAGEGSRDAEFFAVYHPTLVAVILAACDMAHAGSAPGGAA